MTTRPATRAALAGLAVLLTLGFAVRAYAAGSDSYAIITGTSQGTILGDSTAKEAPGAILVGAVGFGLSVPTGGGTSGGGAIGAPLVRPFTLVKTPDKASPKLLRAAFTGEQLTVLINWFMTDPLGKRAKTFTVILEEAMIADIDTQGTVLQGTSVAEQITLRFTRITFRDERSVPPVQVCLNVVANGLC
jgi:type VI secretion system secreted protein Hcp